MTRRTCEAYAPQSYLAFGTASALIEANKHSTICIVHTSRKASSSVSDLEVIFIITSIPPLLALLVFGLLNGLVFFCRRSKHRQEGVAHGLLNIVRVLTCQLSLQTLPFCNKQAAAQPLSVELAGWVSSYTVQDGFRRSSAATFQVAQELHDQMLLCA